VLTWLGRPKFTTTASGIASRDRGINLLRAFKASGCARCGRRYPELAWEQLHIHHRDPAEGARGHLAAKFLSRAPVDVVLASLVRCEVACFECHPLEHNGNGTLTDCQLLLFGGSGLAWHYDEQAA
jgi:hypothetical protein